MRFLTVLHLFKHSAMSILCFLFFLCLNIFLGKLHGTNLLSVRPAFLKCGRVGMDAHVFGFFLALYD